jgi:hypothetical protein
MPATYDIGDSALLHFEVRTLVGGVLTLTNATVTLTVTKPDATTVNPVVANVSTGIYEATLSPDQAGMWLFQWAATGAATTAEDGLFYVQAAASANIYTTLAELKMALSIPPTDTQDDEDLQDAISVASRAIDGDCQRAFYKRTEARTLEPGYDLWNLRLGPFNDLVSVTTLKTDASGDGVFETTWAVGEYQLLCQDGTPNTNAGPEPRPYQRIKATGGKSFPLPSWTGGARSNLIEIAGVWGWPAVPDRIRRAARMMATEQFALRDVKFGAVGMGDLGIIRVRENPKYQRLISDYRLVEAAAPMA